MEQQRTDKLTDYKFQVLTEKISEIYNEIGILSSKLDKSVTQHGDDFSSLEEKQEEEIAKIKTEFEIKYLQKTDFTLIRNIVFGAIATILTAFIYLSVSSFNTTKTHIDPIPTTRSLITSPLN